MSDSLLFLSLIFSFVAIMSANGMITFPVEKLGMPIGLEDVKWTWFVYKHINEAEFLDEKHLIYKDKIFVFLEPWLFEVYEGKTKEEIRHKYALGGQSNKADYLTWWQKIIGRKIESMYSVKF
jgi:hypothetical protein